MQMHPGKPCQHLMAGGCSIYADRPHHPCRTFDCGWKQPNSPLPDDMRPDRCGAIVMLGPDWYEWKVLRAVPAGWTIPEHTLQRIKRFAEFRKLALIYHEFEQKDGVLVRTHKVGFGPPEFVAAFRVAMKKEGAKENAAEHVAENPAATSPPLFE